MTLQQLTYFLAAAEFGSFSAAADSLHMAQPSLSEQIRRLEAELGVPLFTRAGRGLELTEAGRLLLPHAERTLYDARWGSDDPTRRQLTARAQRAGVKLEPTIEVEYLTAALDLATRGLGDTVAARSIVVSRGLGRRLSVVPFDPPLLETFAFIT